MIRIKKTERQSFWTGVLLPAFSPLLVLAVLRFLFLQPASYFLSAAFIIGSGGLYLKRLWEYWRPVSDVNDEIRRFRLLIWLIISLIALNLAFLWSIPQFPDRENLIWIYLLTGGASYYVLLTLILQFSRLSGEIEPSRPRLIIALIIFLFVVFAGWPGGVQFPIFFLLAVWIFGFEGIVSVSNRQKITLTFSCAIGFILLIAVGLDNRNIVIGDVALRTRMFDPVRYLEANLIPFLPAVIGSLKRLILALFIVLPGKILLRPLANWLKIALKIRTKLILSYSFSSVIPGLLLVVILLFGAFFALGGYWQLFTGGMITARVNTLDALWRSSLQSFDGGPNLLRKQQAELLSHSLKSNGISAVVFDTSRGDRAGKVLYLGKILPDLLHPDTSSIDTSEIEHKLLSFTTHLPIMDSTDVINPESISTDSLVIKLGQDSFKGLCWIQDQPYLTCWHAEEAGIVGVFQPFTPDDLMDMKAQTGTDLMVYPGRDFQLSKLMMGGVNVKMDVTPRPVMSTAENVAKKGFLDFPLAFPTLLPSLRWNPENGLEESHSAMVVRTSLYSLFAVLLSTEYVINRIYLAIFAALALFFGAILVLVALVGFGLAGGITRSIRKLRQGTQRLREGDLSVNIEVKSRDELGDLAQSFNLMVADLNRILAEVKEKERMEGELEAARAIQLKLLPERIPSVPGYDMAAVSLPAKQVGGDYYDFIPLDGQLGVAVGDVSGKGVPAALLMANLQASLHTLADTHLSPCELMSRLNRVLHFSTAPQMFATFFFGMLDAESGLLRYANAGHDHPIICGNGRLERLADGGMLLGVVPEGNYSEGRITLQPGEIITLYSDGITEAMDENEREFGEERLINLLHKHCGESAEVIIKSILQEVEASCGTPQDDMTLVVIKRAQLP